MLSSLFGQSQTFGQDDELGIGVGQWVNLTADVNLLSNVRRKVADVDAGKIHEGNESAFGRFEADRVGRAVDVDLAHELTGEQAGRLGGAEIGRGFACLSLGGGDDDIRDAGCGRRDA